MTNQPERHPARLRTGRGTGAAHTGLLREQKVAQGINLLYFLPTAAAALIFHTKNRLIEWKAVVPAAIAGSVTAALAALLSANLEISLLRKLFGGFLILVGLSEVFLKTRKA